MCSPGDSEPLLWWCGAIHGVFAADSWGPDCSQSKEKEGKQKKQEGEAR